MNRDERKELTRERNAWKQMINRMKDCGAIVEQNEASKALLTIDNGADDLEDMTGALLY